MDVSLGVALVVLIFPALLWEGAGPESLEVRYSSFSPALTHHPLFVILGDSENARKITFPALEDFFY